MMYSRNLTTILAAIALLFVVGCEKSDSGGGESSGDQQAAAQQADREAESEESGGEHHHGEEGHAHGDKGHAHEGDEHAHGGSKGEAGDKNGEMVEVPKEGKKFDPSVAVSRLPEGAWHCNMNDKSHYAAMNKGEGKCPICNMKLQKRQGGS